MPLHLKSVSLLLLLTMMVSMVAKGEPNYPENPGELTRHEFIMEMPKAYVSGIMILRRVEPSLIRGSLVNEFGISMLDFSYDESKHKLMIESLMKQLDKWYVRRLLKKDIPHVLEAMHSDKEKYESRSGKLKYFFKPMAQVAGDTLTESPEENTLEKSAEDKLLEEKVLQ